MTQPAASASSPETAPVRYEPGVLEPRWQAAWERAGVFDAEITPGRESFSIVIPPPNVTGALHMGHALNSSVQDCLVRWHRMQGKDVLWMPGVDHAGIATQTVVERQLRAEGTTRHELGREAFLERVWAWKEQSGSTIIDQLRRLGCSLDYRRERFTMDDGYVRAVLVAFTKLYERGLIYRGERLVNWDAGSMSAISDLEVEQREVDDEMVRVAYPVVDGEPGDELVIATVRPETIVADVAVAVHPDDDRFRHLVGRSVRVPMTDRIVPVIADAYVDPEFGTGALKITPGHDPNDFEIGERHGLPALTAISVERTMTELAGRFAGMGTDEARLAMVDELDTLGVLRGREPYRHSVPHSQRSGVRIEPLVSLQWFADMRELAGPALAAARDGSVRFVPEGSTGIFYSWMEDLRPWCLSRQLWWGHQLPVWYCTVDESHVHVSIDGPGDAPCPECGNDGWRRDEDVLDTWFSSGLWDMATLGWPEETPELEHFHPTSVLCTAREIINLWVARMMMFSLDFRGEVPFHDVYIHSVVQASDGRKMSKSLGNGIDPLDMISRFGADATRYGLLDMSSTQDVRFNEGRIREGRDLANKLWNASRLLVGLGDADALQASASEEIAPDGATRLEDAWILRRLDRAQREVHARFGAYDFSLAVKAMYSYVWNELCDWYLECVKERLRSEDHEERREATATLAFVLDRTLRLVHPVMPHVTEEIAEAVWGRTSEACCYATVQWHRATLPDDVGDDGVEARFDRLRTLVTRVRGLRQAADVKPSLRLPAAFSDGAEAEWADSERLLAALAGLDVAGTTADGRGDGWDEGSGTQQGAIALPVEGGTLLLGGLDATALRERLARDLAVAEGEVKRSDGKLANSRFTAKAPAELVAEERAKLDRYRREVVQLRDVMGQLA